MNDKKHIETTPLFELLDELRRVESDIMEMMDYRNQIVMEFWYRIPFLQESEQFRLTAMQEKESGNIKRKVLKNDKIK